MAVTDRGILHTGAAQEFQYQGRTKGSHGFTRRVRSTGKERRNTIGRASTHEAVMPQPKAICNFCCHLTNWSTRNQDQGQQIYYSWVNQAGSSTARHSQPSHIDNHSYPDNRVAEKPACLLQVEISSLPGGCWLIHSSLAADVALNHG